MEKQNRPYSLINIFDNLHGAIKKPSLEAILDALSDSEVLTCKKYGKNKVYFLNQQKFDINEGELEAMNEELAKIRELSNELQTKHKSLLENYKKLVGLKTEAEINEEISTLEKDIASLKAKKERLTNGASSKVSEEIVIKEEKEE
jgi:hypothetical protein